MTIKYFVPDTHPNLSENKSFGCISRRHYYGKKCVPLPYMIEYAPAMLRTPSGVIANPY